MKLGLTMTHRKAIRVPCSSEVFRNIRWMLQVRNIWFIAGINSLYVPSKGLKYLMVTNKKGEKICRDWPDLDGEMVLMSPGEAARTELKREFPDLTRVGWQRSHIALLDARWPMYCVGPVQSPRGQYIDLKGAYHTIYSRLWLDVSFPNGYGTLSLDKIAQRLAEWKGARNSLIGVIRSRDATGVRGFKTIPMQTTNPYLSPGLWSQVQAVLNDVARYAVKLGAVYVATDGYIFPSYKQAERMEEQLFNWGFPYRTVKGDIDIKGWGCYRVGSKQTLGYKPDKEPAPYGFNSIHMGDTRWPTRYVDWWAYAVPRYRSLRGL